MRTAQHTAWWVSVCASVRTVTCSVYLIAACVAMCLAANPAGALTPPSAVDCWGERLAGLAPQVPGSSTTDRLLLAPCIDLVEPHSPAAVPCDAVLCGQVYTLYAEVEQAKLPCSRSSHTWESLAQEQMWSPAAVVKRVPPGTGNQTGHHSLHTKSGTFMHWH